MIAHASRLDGRRKAGGTKQLGGAGFARREGVGEGRCQPVSERRRDLGV